MFAFVSTVAWHQERSRTAAAAWRSWLTVRGSSTARSRGATGNPVSRAAIATNGSACASIRRA